MLKTRKMHYGFQIVHSSCIKNYGALEQVNFSYPDNYVL